MKTLRFCWQSPAKYPGTDRPQRMCRTRLAQHTSAEDQRIKGTNRSQALKTDKSVIM